MRIIAALAVAVLACTVPDAAGAAPTLQVTSYQEEGSPLAKIDASAAALATVGVDGVTLPSNGATVPNPSAAAERQRVRAHADGLEAELLISNFSGAKGDFDEAIAYRLLSSPANIETVAAKLAADVHDRGWDGICVDLESLQARDAAGLVQFLTALRGKLGSAGTISIAVMASTSKAGYAANGYRLSQIAAQVDAVQVMTYDQHGPWEDTPGPIGALAWQRKAIGVALQSVPAGRLDLGVAGYGYAWRPHSNDVLTDARARQEAGSRARWNATVGEWTATMPDGSTLWWSDARSFALRRQLATDLGLHGLALWSLGQSDPVT